MIKNSENKAFPFFPFIVVGVVPVLEIAFLFHFLLNR